MHLTCSCLPFNAYFVSRSWSKLIVFQSFSLWHDSHFVPKFSLCLSSFLWQPMQVVASFSEAAFNSGLWQASHLVVTCLPDNGNLVSLSWSNFADFHFSSLWQVAHLSPN